MNSLLIFSIIAAFFAFVALGVALVVFARYRRCREEIELYAEAVAEMEQSLAHQKQLFETVTTRVSDGARRIAWLETRIRQPKPKPEEPKVEPKKESSATENFFAALAKPTMTERRHRVLTLAKRGQDAESIAATLGMLPGEVELIVNLNRVAV
jgi:DNA-binding NarL/FixJ family response regulator